MSATTDLGAAPASAASTEYDLTTGHHGPAQPRYDAAVARTRPEADRRRVEKYGFRARGTDPLDLFAKADDEPEFTEWFVKWRCTSD